MRQPLLAARIFMVFAVAAFLVAMFGFSWRCGDTCPDSGPGSWWQAYDSWQWSVQFALAGIGLLAGGISISLLKDERRAGRLTLVAAAVAEAAWVVLLLPGVVGGL